ncbi:helix-turn-helix transcriptional regulator [Paenibacillus sp. IHB B 3415]|uniref:helix-turn-helix domain-containing protein n=1 Tax=Paenibacillus sp. IHB B 3415 TaxID=867080 RepID=UPI00062E4F69|nr:helix-turn-helix transcriptional regulator [Paenibacillus sp. IHB B 3415]
MEGELMEKSGLSRNSINKLYRGTQLETIKLETLFKLCDTFQLTMKGHIQLNEPFFCTPVRKRIL